MLRVSHTFPFVFQETSLLKEVAISFDWSYMFFRTRYGTKASIKAEPLVLHHIEPYTPNLINMNCTIVEIDENDMENEPTTSLAEIPTFILDEWANAYQFDPIF